MLSEKRRSKKILLIGSGTYCIGSSVEFDWCGVQVLRTLRSRGIETIFLNSNPETVSTDFDECDKLYFEEITVEQVLNIYHKEKPDGIIFSTGGQISQNVALGLQSYNLPLLGTDIASIEQCEDRNLFSKLCDEIGVDQPEWQEISCIEEAKKFANFFGYPVLIRPSFVLSGSAMAVAVDIETLTSYMKNAFQQSKGASVVISKFYEQVKEIEFDGVAQNGEIKISAISEHIENAGVHSGDATIVLPPQKLFTETVDRINYIAKKLAKKLQIHGPFNIQFLAKENNIKIIECNLRAARTLPFISKIQQRNYIDIAAKIWLGDDIDAKDYPIRLFQPIGVKAAQFSFSRLRGADPLLGVEMSSTGEVACFGRTLEEAFLKSYISVGFRMPLLNSKILVTIGTIKDKAEFLDVARDFQDIGFSFIGTEGTAKFLSKNGVACEKIAKISSGEIPNVETIVSSRLVSLVINTANKFSHEERSDGYLIRRSAINMNIPLIGNLQLAKLIARSLKKFPTMDSIPLE